MSRGWSIFGLLISASAATGGFCGLVWPALFRGSALVEEDYTPLRARITGLVLLVMGAAGVWAIFSYKGGPVDFFPA